MRGPGGGYRLARPVGEIRISEILAAVDETMDALARGAGASGGAGGTPEQVLADKLWERLSANVYVMLHQTRLGDVVRNQLAPCPAVPAFVAVVDEEHAATMSGRVYLDWNATAPLRPEARAAMAAALEVVGNPSSVHAEGRAARAVIERARAQVAEATGCAAGEVVFTSGATEAAALALAGRGCVGAPVEHDCVAAWVEPALPVDADGRVTVAEPGLSVLQAANSETGVVQALPAGLACVDAVQAVGRLPFAFDWTGARAAMVSAHKLGGPKGVGALLLAPGAEVAPVLQGRRAGDAAAGRDRERGRDRRLRGGDRGGGERISPTACGRKWPRRGIFSRRLWHRRHSRLFLSGKGRRGCRTRAASRWRAGRARPR